MTAFGLVEQQGRFLWQLSAAETFLLTAGFCVTSDFCRACMRSSSNGMAGLLSSFSMQYGTCFLTITLCKSVKVFRHIRFLRIPIRSRNGGHRSCEDQWINGHRYKISHGNTEESPVATYFNCEAHTLADMTAVVIDKIYSHTHYQHASSTK